MRRGSDSISDTHQHSTSSWNTGDETLVNGERGGDSDDHIDREMDIRATQFAKPQYQHSGSIEPPGSKRRALYIERHPELPPDASSSTSAFSPDKSAGIISGTANMMARCKFARAGWAHFDSRRPSLGTDNWSFLIATDARSTARRSRYITTSRATVFPCTPVWQSTRCERQRRLRVAVAPLGQDRDKDQDQV